MAAGAARVHLDPRVAGSSRFGAVTWLGLTWGLLLTLRRFALVLLFFVRLRRTNAPSGPDPNSVGWHGISVGAGVSNLP